MSILMDTSNKQQYRKIQGILGDQSFSVVLPKHYAQRLGISKGQYVKVILDGDRIVIQKAE
ncbi:MAG: AbrB/MazE/SpoVT family DNA-binding domain-containing protein [Nitrososphaeraceae archaeon]